MAYTELTVSGYCGFAEKKSIQFAVPNGMEGSGLTFLVGPNNSGKSAIVESVHALLAANPPKIPESKRNTATNRRVEIALRDKQGIVGGVKTRELGGEPTEWFPEGQKPSPTALVKKGDENTHPSKFHHKIFALPSRRNFPALFGDSGGIERADYMLQLPFPFDRNYGLQTFARRLARIQMHQGRFNEVLAKVMSPLPRWHLEQIRGNNAQSYMSINVSNGSHDSDGLGEGILSVLFIVDALYDSQPDQMIIIDEPELSLHPLLQRRVAELLREYSKDRQIVIATHSPLFITWSSLFAGGSLVRVVNRGNGTQVFTLGKPTIDKLRGLAGNFLNPHVLGVEAAEIFFHDDPVILVEGQDDAVFYPRIAQELGVTLNAQYFGWGAGGVNNIGVFAQVLKDLGFIKVAAIVDGNAVEEAKRLHAEYTGYRIHIIPAEDVRTKEKRETKGTRGILDKSLHVDQDYAPAIRGIFQDINEYVRSIN